jgi:hypothetical protein
MFFVAAKLGKAANITAAYRNDKKALVAEAISLL